MLVYMSSNLSDDIVNNDLGRIIHIFTEQILDRISTKKYLSSDRKLIECQYEGNELSGIISYLTQTYGDDLSTSSGKITSLIKYESNHINDVYNVQNNGPAKKSEGWIEFDFGSRKINISSYTIRTSSFGKNSYSHPKSWSIIGSNDRNEWTTLNQQTNDSSLNGPYKQHRFECKENKDFYRYIRYIQEDSWDEGYQYNIYLSCIEFFGSILSS